jgi:hypothetical protein
MDAHLRRRGGNVVFLWTLLIKSANNFAKLESRARHFISL